MSVVSRLQPETAKSWSGFDSGASRSRPGQQVPAPSSTAPCARIKPTRDEGLSTALPPRVCPSADCEVLHPRATLRPVVASSRARAGPWTNGPEPCDQRRLSPSG